MRYSLRSLAICVTLIAVALGSWAAYRRTRMCRLEWLAPDSPRAVASLCPPVIRLRDDGYFAFIYHPRYVPGDKLVSSLEDPPGADCKWTIPSPWLGVACSTRAAAESLLARAKSLDVRPAGVFMIHGRIVDRQGRPFRAMIELLDCKPMASNTYTLLVDDTNQEGYFAISLFGWQPVARESYFFRVRNSWNWGRSDGEPFSFDSERVSIDPAALEQDVIVTVPR